MQYINGTIDVNIQNDSVVTIGKFDGFHKGHGVILNKMKEYQRTGLAMVGLTFDKSPSSILGEEMEVLSLPFEKKLIFEENSFDYLVELPFYEKTASISAEHFIEEFLVTRLKAKVIVVGPDCRFGHRAKGDVEMLKKYSKDFGYTVEVVDKLKDGDREISSSYLRELCIEGNVKKINELSMQPYFMTGFFAHGMGSGQSIDMPFCVMNIDKRKLLPRSGVYFSRVVYDEYYYPALTWIDKEKGTSETVLYGGNRRIGSVDVSVALFEFFRDTMKFESDEKMKRQLQIDLFEGEKWHKEHRGI